MKLSIIFSLFILILSTSDCSNSNSRTKEEIFGFYTSKKYNYIMRNILFLSGKPYVLGSTLEIKRDSSYIKTTCGSISSGYWKLRGDTLLLFCQKFTHRNDSLNSVWDTDCSQSVDTFYIHPNGELRQKFFIKEFKQIALNYFVKVK